MTNLDIMKPVLLGSALLAASSAMAVPAKPGLFPFEQPDGSIVTVRLMGDERFHFHTTADSLLLAEGSDGFLQYADADLRATGVRYTGPVAPAPAAAAKASKLRAKSLGKRAKARMPENMLTTTFPSSGSPRALVVLVEFTDVRFSMLDPVGHYTQMLTEEGFTGSGAVGSASDYFKTCSMGKFDPQFDVYGPVALARNQAYYGRNDAWGDDMYPYKMAIEACEIIDDTVDLSVYDNDGDGKIDNIYVFYAGMGEANSGVKNTVWPHSFDISEYGEYPEFDGVVLDHYACSNELYPTEVDRYGNVGETEFEGIGTFVHEFSHVLGLPDLYVTSYSSGYTPGEWSVLDYGPYNCDGHVPPLYSAFERVSMGWVTPKELTGPDDITLYPIVENDVYMIPTDNDNEFFLFENRQQRGFDTYIPGHGMLIWHIDYDDETWYNNAVNNTASHQRVDLVEADNSQSEYKTSRASEAWPGTRNKTSFTSTTTPAMKAWSGYKPELPLTEIAEDTDGIITFKVAGGKVDGLADVAAEQSGLRIDGLTVSSADGSAISLYTVDGRLAGTGASVTAPARGIYIVAAGGSRTKLAL